MSRRDIEDKVFNDVGPLVEGLGLGVQLLDVELTSENKVSVLRATIYKPDGITLDDCAAVQRALSDRLDETDPVPGSYTLEVSSPGLERSLRRDKEFEIYKGLPCQVNLFAPVDKKRTFQGELAGLTLTPAGVDAVEISTTDGPLVFERNNISKVSLVYQEKQQEKQQDNRRQNRERTQDQKRDGKREENRKGR